MAAQENHGPLPTILGVLTLLTGFVDAVTYLKFGHVFVANMTGNVVFIAFGFAGQNDISIVGSLLALVTFLVGALAGGWLSRQFGMHRGNLLCMSALVNVALLAGATVEAALGATAFAIIPMLGITMGIQNAVARKLAVADITTTVLTLTVTGIMADSSLVGGSNPRLTRRLPAVLTMFIGALVGAVVVLRWGVPPALALAAIIVASAGIATYLLSRDNPEWTRG